MNHTFLPFYLSAQIVMRRPNMWPFVQTSMCSGVLCGHNAILFLCPQPRRTTVKRPHDKVECSLEYLWSAYTNTYLKRPTDIWSEQPTICPILSNEIKYKYMFILPEKKKPARKRLKLYETNCMWRNCHLRHIILSNTARNVKKIINKLSIT